MTKSFRVFGTACALLALLAVGAYSKKAPAKPPLQSVTVVPGAVKLLQRMTDYLSTLKQFTVVALNMREDVLEIGAKSRFEASSKVAVSRPNKLQGERKGH